MFFILSWRFNFFSSIISFYLCRISFSVSPSAGLLLVNSPGFLLSENTFRVQSARRIFCWMQNSELIGFFFFSCEACQICYCFLLSSVVCGRLNYCFPLCGVSVVFCQLLRFSMYFYLDFNCLTKMCLNMISFICVLLGDYRVSWICSPILRSFWLLFFQISFSAPFLSLLFFWAQTTHALDPFLLLHISEALFVLSIFFLSATVFKFTDASPSCLFCFKSSWLCFVLAIIIFISRILTWFFKKWFLFFSEFAYFIYCKCIFHYFVIHR